MPAITIITGLLLIIIGLGGYFAADEPDRSPTALIPAAFGVLIGICGLLAWISPFRKHVMHLAAALALLGVVGGTMPLFRNSFDFTKLSVQYGAMMIVVCVIFLIICIRSFVQARVMRDRDRTYSVQA